MSSDCKCVKILQIVIQYKFYVGNYMEVYKTFLMVLKLTQVAFVLFAVADPGGPRGPGPPVPTLEHTFCTAWHKSI